MTSCAASSLPPRTHFSFASSWLLLPASCNACPQAKPNYDLLRGQILRLCGGMQRVAMTFGDDERLRASLAFLQAAHPLQYVSPVKKSQVHHALAEMLNQVRLPP